MTRAEPSERSDGRALLRSCRQRSDSAGL